nr:GDP-mannose 4,6-dehydratase [Mesorhizobium sanjuanii]
MAKLYAYWITMNYREVYGLCGILFNHEGPTRGETFITRKVTRALARSWPANRTVSISETWKQSATEARRAPIEGMWRILQHQPDDFVLATGETHTVRTFVGACRQASRKGDRLGGRRR